MPPLQAKGGPSRNLLAERALRFFPCARFDDVTAQEYAARPMRLLHTASVLVSALLLFLIEPMVARALLPLYGGSPAVWNTCLLFFQGLLLAGYAYAHFGARWLGERGQLVVHAAILLAPLALLPPHVPVDGPPASAWPVPSLLLALMLAVGAPFFVLTTNSSLQQKWLARRSGESPYFLYAASNVGSFAALLAYPFLVEPAAGVHAQLRGWSLGYLVFVALAGATVVTAWRSAPAQTEARVPSLPARVRARWTVRAAIPSLLLLAVSMTITTDVASIPLLWVVPLALYLATFVVAFWPRVPFPRRALVVIGGLLMAVVLTQPAFGRGMLSLRLGMPLALLVAGCWLCHGDLARDRPDPAHLTDYFLWIAVGGFLGGVLGNLIAPRLFRSIAEYPIALALMALAFSFGEDQGAALWAALKRPITWARIGVTIAAWLGWAIVARGNAPEDWSYGPLLLVTAAAMMWRLPTQFAVAIACAAVVSANGLMPGVRNIDARRSFFGLLRVRETDGLRTLVHGTTRHGGQTVDPFDPKPRLYYTPMSPLSRAMVLQHDGARIGGIGLGTGSIAYYAKPQQHLRFYEIDPIVEPMARRWFTFLDQSPAHVDVRLGDARLTLRDEPDGQLDLLYVDAFSSDAIPVHLITVEAMQLYLAKLKPDGVVIMHISNRYLYLARVLRGTARALGLDGAHIDYKTDPAEGSSVEAVALARGHAPLQPLLDRGWDPLGDDPSVLWTDDRSNLLSVIH
jgi:hypothetical protein